MIDTLMMAYTVETVSVEKVMACMQQYSTDYPDGDVPYDTEDAVTSWMNKVFFSYLSPKLIHNATQVHLLCLIIIL